MPSPRLFLVGIATIIIVLALVLGSAFGALRDSLRGPREPRQRRGHARSAERFDPSRYTPKRTRLRWYSPELLAVLLLSLAAGLWLARLVA